MVRHDESPIYQGKMFIITWCGRGESNPHEVALTALPACVSVLPALVRLADCAEHPEIQDAHDGEDQDDGVPPGEQPHAAEGDPLPAKEQDSRGDRGKGGKEGSADPATRELTLRLDAGTAAGGKHRGHSTPNLDQVNYLRFF